MNHPIDFERAAERIAQTVRQYVRVCSFTDTRQERNVEEFFLDHFSVIPYYREHPNHYGIYRIPGDPHERGVCWALCKGEGPDTVVMVHHYDTVGIEDFRDLKDYALEPDALREQLLDNIALFSGETRADIESGDYAFGRGICDMKGGGAIQYTLLEQYTELPDFQGNVIVIGVPDEENLSAGMRGAVRLLAELKENYGLRYKLMINSEPHQRRKADTGIISLGSMGKMMAFVYVRGSLSHCGKVFEGLNPVNVLSEIVRRTELNMDLADFCQGESAMPPTWLYAKDSKDVYDVSLPLSAYGCLSVLNLTMTPPELLRHLQKICSDSFDAVLSSMHKAWRTFCAKTGRPEADLPWKNRVTGFRELCAEAEAARGETFRAALAEKKKSLRQQMRQENLSIVECNLALVDFVYDYVPDIAPRVVYGLVPPYYPCVSDLEYEKTDPQIAGLFPQLQSYAADRFGQKYDKEYFFSGLSDLSYTGLSDPAGVEKALREEMPLYGDLYDLPVDAICAIAMPCINIGPWGKDFHKLTERVYLEDLLHQTPMLVDRAVKYMLG